MAQEKPKSLEEIPDDELVLLAQGDDKDALECIVVRYKNFVKARARTYFLIGADREDIIQEGMIGLFKAIRDFSPGKLASFRSFADVCIRRQMITAVKSATRLKHIPLNSYISLNRPVYDETGDQTFENLIRQGNTCDPEEMMINREEYSNIGTKVSKLLSSFELLVLLRYLDGKSYQEIAKDLGRQPKSIDNALQRIKRKVEKYLQEQDDDAANS